MDNVWHLDTCACVCVCFFFFLGGGGFGGGGVNISSLYLELFNRMLTCCCWASPCWTCVHASCWLSHPLPNADLVSSFWAVDGKDILIHALKHFLSTEKKVWFHYHLTLFFGGGGRMRHIWVCDIGKMLGSMLGSCSFMIILWK